MQLLLGICAKKIGLNITHNGRFTYHYIKQNFCLYKQLITVHYQDPELLQQDFDSILESDVEKKCQKEDQVFLVHKWLIENVFMVNEPKKRRCS